MIKQYEIYQDKEKKPYLDIIHILDIENTDPTIETTFEKLSLLNQSIKMSELKNEYFYVIASDENNFLKGIYLLSIGNEDSANADNKKFVSFLLLIGATSFITVHNHPNGNLMPSNSDKITSESVFNISELINIRCEGNYIITKEGYCNIETELITNWKGVD